MTDASTVYTAFCNFKNLLSQLKQKTLPVACNEGVYCIARHIILNNEEEFKGIQLFLGNFYIIKTLLGSMETYLKGSGAGTNFSETGLFSVTVTDKVLNREHYARCVQGFNFLAKALRSKFYTHIEYTSWKKILFDFTCSSSSNRIRLYK